MGFFRFRRSVRILPAVRLNFGKRSASVSIGVRSAHVTLGQRQCSDCVTPLALFEGGCELMRAIDVRENCVALTFAPAASALGNSEAPSGLDLGGM